MKKILVAIMALVAFNELTGDPFISVVIYFLSFAHTDERLLFFLQVSNYVVIVVDWASQLVPLTSSSTSGVSCASL